MSPLTKLQQDIAEELLNLALEGSPAAAAALPGATIAQQAAAKAGGAATGHRGAPKKVATALGSSFYKLPIGATIIPHFKYPGHGGYEHFIKGQPSHFDTSISQAKWVANQWKDKDQAEQHFHQGLNAGTHRLVQAGDHEFAVHKSIQVHVPKHTDLTNPEAVRDAPKMFTKKGEDGKPAEHMMFNGKYPGSSKPIPHDDAAQDAQDKYWKPLHPAEGDAEPEHKKAVVINGKHAAWVPDTWKVYKSPAANESLITGKWAKSPDGTWHKVGKNGHVSEALVQNGDQWVKDGDLVEDTEPAHEHATLPAPGHKGPAEPTVGVPAKEGEPISVTKEGLAKALAVLQDNKSTLVNTPLAKAGHPLHAMDYHGIAAAELAKHPELKVAPGTKKAHVGQVKLAVMHYLSGRAAHLSKTQAEEQVLEAVKDHAEAEAQHAAQLTPHTADVGGVQADKEQIQAAIDLLEAKKSTSIKQPLNHAGNPLGAADYWAVIHAYEDAHPDTGHLPQGKGTKTEHFGYAKTVFIAALQEKLAQLGKADQATGYDDAAAVHDLLAHGVAKGGFLKSADGAIAGAAMRAVKFGETAYVWKPEVPGTYSVTPVKPPAGAFYFEVTPQLKVTAVSYDGSIVQDFSADVPEYVKAWITPGAGAAPAPLLVKKYEPPKEPEPEWEKQLIVPPAEPEPPAEPQGVPAINPKTGAYLGEFPPGSVLYTRSSYSEYVFARDPSGHWWYTGTNQVTEAPSYYASDVLLAKGLLAPKEAPTVTETGAAKETAEVKNLLKHGAMGLSPDQLPGGKQWHAGEPVFPSWAQAAAYSLSTGQKGAGGDKAFILPAPGGGFYATVWLPAVAKDDARYEIVTASLQVTHSPADGSEPELPSVLRQDLFQAIKASVVPGAVAIDGKVHQFGYWKNPKGSTYLHVKPAKYAEYWKYGTAAHASYAYVDSNGNAKDVTPAFAAKQLAKATEYSATVPVKEEKPTFSASHVTLYAPGTYQAWEGGTGKVSEKETLEVKPDGSVVLNAVTFNMPMVEDTVTALLKHGVFLDNYSTTVVKPGVQPDAYHIWGSDGKTPEQVKELLDWLDANPEVTTWAVNVKDWFGGDWEKSFKYGPGKQFVTAHGAETGAQQRALFTALLRELLGVPKLPEDAKLAAVPGKPEGPVFLKSLPEGIASAKDVFTFIPNGQAKPYQGSLPKYVISLTVPELKDMVKKVSQQFGDGKVVGTHLSGLNSTGLADWLTAWKKGDMVAVFALDASAGKVSPAHPGAPDNAATHHVTWAPLDPNQVPASQDVPGEWTSLDDTSLITKAEADNYLIKAQVQHAEYLTSLERNNLVIAHRKHDQVTVDILTGYILDRMAAGAPPKTDPPAWTEGLKPAKAYDAVLQAGTPATSWSGAQVKAFAADHAEEIMPYLDEIAQEQGHSGGKYLLDNEFFSYIAKGVASWQQNEHAKEVAEKSIPVWKKAATGDLPSHGHEIYKATKTIPYTGQVTSYFVKPAPGGKQFRLEQEHAANLLGRLLGYQTAESVMLTDPEFGPDPVQAQKAVPGEPLGHYTDMPPWSQFTVQQVADIAVEHLLDHVLSNDDTSANNMIKTPAGRIVGIDKGRSWGDLNWDSLSGNASMDSMTQLVYTKLYGGIRSHQVTKEQADAAYVAVIQRARRVQDVPEHLVQKILDAGFAHRTGKWGDFGSRQGLIDEVLRRKGSLEEDFAKLWQGVYADAGIGPLPEVPVQAVPDAHGAPLHSGFSEHEFAGHVAKAKSHGVAAFFGGRELRDMHVLVHQQKESTGDKVVTHGETFLRGPAYQKVVNWLKAKASPFGHHAAAAPAEDTAVSYPGDAYGPGKPPAGSPDRGGVSGEANYYNVIIRAARSVTKHKSDGNYTSSSSQTIQSALDVAQKNLESTKALSEDVVANPDNVPPSAIAEAKNFIEMAKLYLDHIAKVRAAKEGAYGFAQGDLPRWLPAKAAEPKKEEPPEDELGQLGIKLDFGVKALHDRGSLNDKGEFVAGVQTPHQDPGKWWRMTLPDGEEIILGDGQDTGIELAHWGRIRFTTPHADAASLERIRRALQLTGLEMNEATPRDFELFYWRHLLAIMGDRADGKQQPVWPVLRQELLDRGVPGAATMGGHQKFIDALEEVGQGDPQAETDIYRKAFATLTSAQQVQDFADKGGFFPVQKHFDPNSPATASGKPDWYRFDLVGQVPDLPAPIRQTSNSSVVAERTVQGGGSYGRDALARVLGAEAQGMSNPYQSGATAYVFTRLNISSDRAIVFTPLAMARTRNYSYNADMFGNQVHQSKGGYNEYSRQEYAYWNPEKWKHYSGGNNETMISDALSFLDDVELVQAGTESKRQELIGWLKDRGITEVRHMPVEDRIVTYIGAAAMGKVKANWAAHPELLDPFAQAEQQAEAKALDTSAAAQAAETGNTILDSPPPAVSEHVKVMLEELPTAKAIYQPDNKEVWYVQHNSGSWDSYNLDLEGELQGPFPESEDFGKALNSHAAAGKLVKVWSSGPTTGEMLDKIKALGESWTQHGTVYEGHGYAITPAGGGSDWILYKSSGAFVGQYNSLDAAKAAAISGTD